MTSRFLISILSIVLCYSAHGQMTRGAMDVERSAIDLDGEEAYDTGIKFIKSDSSYYLGWLYLGAAMHQRAADIMGYQKCTEPLLRAKILIEREYGKVLATRMRSEQTFFENYYLFQDYNYLAYYLSSSYSIIDKPDSVFWVADAYQRMNIQKDLAYYNGPFISKAWTVYRNRNYTSDDFGFLRGSLDSNMDYVHELLDSARARIEANVALNDQVIGYLDNSADFGTLYHLESIIYAYEKEYEKAEQAYNELESYGLFSYNNYALLKLSEGEFEEAFRYFDYNKKVVPYHKALEEWIYFEGILNTYRHDNKSSIKALRDWIKTVGSTPGYGWYNIGLARSLLYNGDLQAARAAWTKAKNFTEYHIGTTLGEESYEQALEFLDVLMTDYEMRALKFENPRWFFSLKQIGRYINIRWKLMIKRWKILNEVAGYQDREKLIYDLFSGENTSGWYDIFHTLRDFSVRYFSDYYEKLVLDENTPLGLRPYYRYALASLYQRGGQRRKAREHLEALEKETNDDYEFDRLLHFFMLDSRIALGMTTEKQGNSQMYDIYPELIPYTSHRLLFQLEVIGVDDDLTRDCIQRMKSCRVDFVEGDDPTIPTVNINSVIADDQNFLIVNVSRYGKKLMDPYKLSIAEESDGIKIAYAIFNIFNLDAENQR